jgi:hypothetical protein
MRRNRGVLAWWLGLALSVGLSCTAGEGPLGNQADADPPGVEQPVPPGDSGTPTPPDSGSGAPPDSSTVPPGDTVGVPPSDSGSVPPADSGGLAKTSLLICQLQEYAVTTTVIGPHGGQITVGNHSLTIYENALSADVTITAEQVEGTVNSVRFSPEGLQFAVPAALSLSYQNCAAGTGSKRVVYTDESLNILELPPSVDDSVSTRVKGEIDHFSRYAVAY